MSKHSFKQLILNEINNHPRGFITELANIAGYNQSGGLTKVLNKEEKEFEKFQGLVNMVEYLWGKKSVDIMVRYSKEVDPNKKTARNFLEYLVVNRRFEDFNELIERMKRCSNKESKEWAKIYQFRYKYELAKTEEDYNLLLNEISETNVNIYELNIYKKMLLNYCYNQLKDYTMVKYLTVENNSEVELINNDYIKNMYIIKSNESMAHYNLIINNSPELARKYAESILSISVNDVFKAYAYFIIGYSYTFITYEKSIYYLNKSMELYKVIGRNDDINDINEKIELVSVYWDRIDGECIYTNNQILLDIKKGKEVNLSKIANKEYYYYLEGLITNNEKKLLLSLIKFVKKNNFFMANFPKIELLKRGYDNEILEELMTLE